MKKMIALLTAGILFISMTACQKEPPPTEPQTMEKLTDTDTAGSTFTVTFSNSWTAVPLENSEVTGFTRIIPIGDMFLLTGTNENNRLAYRIYEPEQKNFLHPLQYPEQVSDTTIVSVADMIKDNDEYIVIYSSYETEPEYMPYSYYAEIYDTEWNFMEVQDITNKISKDRSITSAKLTPEGNYCVIESSWGASDVRFYDKQWNSLGKLAGSIDSDSELFYGTDQKLYLKENNHISQIDTSAMTREKLKISNMPSEISGVCTGGNALFYLYDGENMYSVDESYTCQEILNWDNSDFLGETIRSAVMLSDNQLFISCFQMDSGESFWMMNPRTQQEVDSMELITLASISDDQNTRQAVQHFNRQNTQYRIVIQDYSEYYDDTSDENPITPCVEAFEKDLINGNVPDIICTKNLPYENYIRKNLFEDLYSFMETDEEFNQNDYLMNFFSACDTDGKLYSLSYYYTLYTVAGKSEFVGTQQGITLEDYNRIAQNLPSDMLFADYPTKTSIFKSYFNWIMGNFINLKENTCTFNTPELISFLEFCNTFPDNRDDYSMGDEDEDYQIRYIKNKVCLDTVAIHSPYDYHNLLTEDFGGTEVTLIGYPTLHGENNGAAFLPQGNLAMYHESKYKAQIWEFFKMLLSDEYQESLELPVKRSALQKQMENAMISDNPVTQTEVNELTELIQNTTNTIYINVKIDNIISEETEMYFAGDQSAEKCAEMIQNRVSLYLSEQS